MASRAIFLIALVSLTAAASSPCWANLGDTLNQSIAHYGRPIEQGVGDASDTHTPWYLFTIGKFKIEEQFGSGIAFGVQYWKEDRSAFSDSEQEEILKAESAKLKWGKPFKPNAESTMWLREDGAHAEYSCNKMLFWPANPKR